MTRMYVFLASAILLGCSTKRVSTIGSVQPQQPNATLEASDQCGWVQVNEVLTKSVLGLPISSTPRQFTKQLYYCCPGPKESPAPSCYQAEWLIKP